MMWNDLKTAVDLLHRINKRLMQLETRLMSALDNLRAQVERNTSVTDSAITLLQGLKAQLDNAIASGDPAAVQAVADNLGAETDKLAAAVTANTPAATPTPTPTPTP